MKRALVLISFVACGEPARPVAPAPSSSTTVTAPSPSSTTAAKEEEEEGTIVEDANPRPAQGGVELAGEKKAVFRDGKDRLRTFDLTPRELRSDEHHPVTLAIGDRVALGPWTIRWIAVRDGLVRLHARHRDTTVDDWGSAVSSRIATREVRTSDKLFTIEVKLEAMNGRPDRSDGRIELSVRTTETLTSARFGDRLSPGAFLFPSGLRLAVEQTSMCDFDPSAPCPFGGSYRVHAALGDKEAHEAIKTARTTVLGHVVEMGLRSFVVRK